MDQVWESLRSINGLVTFQLLVALGVMVFAMYKNISVMFRAIEQNDELAAENSELQSKLRLAGRTLEKSDSQNKQLRAERNFHAHRTTVHHER